MVLIILQLLCVHIVVMQEVLVLKEVYMLTGAVLGHLGGFVGVPIGPYR